MLDRDRFVVDDTAWEKVAPLLPGKPTDPGGTGKDNRLFLEAVLWRVRAGGALARSAQRFRQVEQRLPALPPLGEGRRVRARLRLPVWRAGLRICPDRWHHRHRPPEGEWRKGGTQAQAIGRSRGGLTTKIVALADALGNLVRFVLLPGQRHDTLGVPPLIEGVAFGGICCAIFKLRHYREISSLDDAPAGY